MAVASGDGRSDRIRRVVDSGEWGVRMIERVAWVEGEAVGGSTERRRRPIQGRATTRTPVARPNSFRGKFLFWCLYISSHSVSAAVRNSCPLFLLRAHHKFPRKSARGVSASHGGTQIIPSNSLLDILCDSHSVNSTVTIHRRWNALEAIVGRRRTTILSAGRRRTQT